MVYGSIVDFVEREKKGKRFEMDGNEKEGVV